MNEGKLIITEHHNKIYTLLISQNRLLSVDVSDNQATSLVGNIYIGKVKNISVNIQAAFVEIQKDILCFLPLSDCNNAHIFNRQTDDRLKEGDEILVQVIRDAIKTKQPVISTKISLSGNYLVIASDGSKVSFSKKMNLNKKREICDYLISQNIVNKDYECQYTSQKYSMVIRTNAAVLEDYSQLYKEWTKLLSEYEVVFATASYRTSLTCLRRIEIPYLEHLKNYYQTEYNEIITDSKDIYEVLLSQDINNKTANNNSCTANIRLYQDEYPLSKLYSIKKLIEDALYKRVWLKSGGYLMIESTEALTAIDVNTGKYEARKSNEETFFHINMEAAKEIAIQLRVRNISGIIIVDFINMSDKSMQHHLLDSLKKFVQTDSIPTQVIDMTPLGLVEITRKRVSRPLYELIDEF
ncbi:MAG TPA: ribonuclease E/G [Lachnospiraceae bacterium]|nr:ribonuclease E/G [Lachnospiraceae bacterium]